MRIALLSLPLLGLAAFGCRGTALVAAQKHKWQWIGIVVSPTTSRLMTKRLRDARERSDEPLRGGRYSEVAREEIGTFFKRTDHMNRTVRVQDILEEAKQGRKWPSPPAPKGHLGPRGLDRPACRYGGRLCSLGSSKNQAE